MAISPSLRLFTHCVTMWFMFINHGESTHIAGRTVQIASIDGTVVTFLVDEEQIAVELGQDFHVHDEVYTLTMLWSPATYQDGHRGDGHSFSAVIVPAQNGLLS